MKKVTLTVKPLSAVEKNAVLKAIDDAILGAAAESGGGLDRIPLLTVARYKIEALA